MNKYKKEKSSVVGLFEKRKLEVHSISQMTCYIKISMLYLMGNLVERIVYNHLSLYQLIFIP